MKFDKVYLIGNGRVADDCLRILAKRGVPVEFLEVFEEKFSFTEKLCGRLGIPFTHYSKVEVTEFLLGLKEKVLIISAHNSYIFPAAVCEKDNLTIINLHIAYLPEYRGMNPTTWAIFNQEKYAGVTLHTVSAKIDNGGIIVQKKIEIGEDDTAMKLMLNCFREGIKLFEENLDAFLNKTYDIIIPPNPNTRLYLGKEMPNDGILDHNWDFAKTYAFLRSMDYTGANLMRLPRVIYDDTVYEITKYRKSVGGEYSSYRKAVIVDNVLIINWGAYSLSCTLREVGYGC